MVLNFNDRTYFIDNILTIKFLFTINSLKKKNYFVKTLFTIPFVEKKFISFYGFKVFISLVLSVRECKPLYPPKNGDIIPSICKTKPLHGQRCFYKCGKGYKVLGPFSTMCDNGNWTQGGFTCRGKYRICCIVSKCAI